MVIINCFDTYEQRVQLLKKHFSECKKDVHVLTSDWRHFQKTMRSEHSKEYELVHVRPYYKNLSIARMISHYCFARDSLCRVEELRPDLMWVLVPPNSLVKAAAMYKKKYPETKLVFDFIDMWPETMPITKMKTIPPFLWWRDIRNDYVNAGDAIVTECSLYQQELKKSCDLQRMHTLYLAKEITPIQPNFQMPENKISLCYLGSINNIIDIPCIGGIIEKIDAPVDLHIIGDGEKKQELINTATTSGANVIFHGKLYDNNEKKKIFDQCHYGLNIMKNSVFVGLTMKSMDYFEYGVPIINNIKGDTWEFVEKYGLGINYDATTQLDVSILRNFARKRACVRNFFEKTFSYECFSDGIDQIIDVLDHH